MFLKEFFEKAKFEKKLADDNMSRERSGPVVGVLDSRLWRRLTGDCGDRWFEPHRCHCVVVFEQDTFILA